MQKNKIDSSVSNCSKITSNSQLILDGIEDFTCKLRRSIQSMETLHDLLSQVKKHPDIDKDIERAETIRTATVDITDALLITYNLTLEKLQ